MLSLEHYKNAIINYQGSTPWLPELQWKEYLNFIAYYSPFEHINTKARIVLIGISPGATQAHNANIAAREALRTGKTMSEALHQAKNTASFSGALRNNLVNLLNYIDIHNLLNIDDCSTLFNYNNHLVHYTSAFRNPILKNGNPVSTAKGYKNNPLLLEMIEQCLAEELRQLPNALLVPLGQGVDDALMYLAEKGIISEQQILSGLPHPSGANAERVAYFLDKKPRENLSSKVNPDKLDKAKANLIQKVSQLIDKM